MRSNDRHEINASELPSATELAQIAAALPAAEPKVKAAQALNIWIACHKAIADFRDSARQQDIEPEPKDVRPELDFPASIKDVLRLALPKITSVEKRQEVLLDYLKQECVPYDRAIERAYKERRIDPSQQELDAEPKATAKELTQAMRRLESRKFDRERFLLWKRNIEDFRARSIAAQKSAHGQKMRKARKKY